MQRIVFDSATSAAVAATVLHDEPALRDQIAGVVTTATAAKLGVPPAQLGPQIDQTLQIPAGAALARGILGDVHARLVGARSAPVVISPTDMVQLVRNQVVATVPAAPLPVETISWLDTVRRALTFFVPIAALAGVVALVFGFLAHPRRADAVFGVGMFCVFAAVLGGLLGYVVPAFLLPVLERRSVDGDRAGRRQRPAPAHRRGVGGARRARRGADPRLDGLPQAQDAQLVVARRHDPLLRPAPLELTAAPPPHATGGHQPVPYGPAVPSGCGMVRRRRRYDVSSAANSANTSA